MLINEAALRDATRAEVLELQTYLIDHVEGAEGVDFELREHRSYGFVVHLTHKGEECDVVRLSRQAMSGPDYSFGVKVKGKQLRLSQQLETLVSDVHDWLNGWISLWD